MLLHNSVKFEKKNQQDIFIKVERLALKIIHSFKNV